MLDLPHRDIEAPPLQIRAHGGVRVRFGQVGARTARLESAESGGYRARFPNREDGACEAVLINTGGGMTGGDSLRVDIAAEAGADAVVGSQAAEKIYRSPGPATRIETRLTLAAGARLDWLPQETILFGGSSLIRSLDVEMARDARLFACESLFFGRAAMGESLTRAELRDRWRVRRGGRLIFADDLRLEGAASRLLDRPALGGGAKAAATALLVAPDAAARLEPLRETLADAGSEWGASALDGFLVARLLSPDAATLRADLARLAIHLTGRKLPRSWQN